MTTTQPPPCLFCRVIRREVPARIVFEDDHVLAFHDVNPQAPTHVLVIPKVHLTGLNDLDGKDETHAALGVALWQGAQRAARETGVAESGYRTVVNTGRDASQSVPHLHVHVLGGRTLTWPPG